MSGLVLGAAIADRRRSELLRQTDHALATILSEERDLKHATPRIIQAVCETLEWEVGILWQTDEATQTLDYVDSWHREPASRPNSSPTAARASFDRASACRDASWSTGRPAWIYDVTVDPNFPRSPVATRLGLHGGFAFPLLIGSRVLGVIEFFTSSSTAGGPVAADADGSRRRADRSVHRTTPRRAARRPRAKRCIRRSSTRRSTAS